MNAPHQRWDVPSVNLLGAVDDGTGKWVDGFWWDSLHPNAAGHAELATTFVPSLFDALDRGMPTPRRVSGPGSRGLTGGAAPDLRAGRADASVCAGLTVRASGDGPIATVTGTALDPDDQHQDGDARRPGAAPTRSASTTLQPGRAVHGRRSVCGAASGPTRSPAGEVVASTVPRRRRLASVAGQPLHRARRVAVLRRRRAGRPGGRSGWRRPASSSAARPSARRMDLNDVLIYRSALNEDEVAARTVARCCRPASRSTRRWPMPRFVAARRGGGIRAQSLAALTLERAGQIRVAPTAVGDRGPIRPAEIGRGDSGGRGDGQERALAIDVGGQRAR